MKEFTLTVTEQELSVLSAGLSELAYKHSAALISKLQGQINEQIGGGVREDTLNTDLTA